MNIFKQRTTWAGIAGLITAVGGYFTGDLTAVQAISIAVTALVGVLAQDAEAPGSNTPVQDPTLPKGH